ncbi:asparagine synthase-related protein [Mesorhizobium calcicola]|uniref:Asparagine synthase-related protein n=1 Tax=Mesorhizobium calcicola TaxID=1300310 RepID=A0ABW4WQ16_9HYPH
MVADVPSVCFLSGGLDSTFVAALDVEIPRMTCGQPLGYISDPRGTATRRGLRAGGESAVDDGANGAGVR